MGLKRGHSFKPMIPHKKVPGNVIYHRFETNALISNSRFLTWAMLWTSGLKAATITRHALRVRWVRVTICSEPVSYTHLDVYKRQAMEYFVRNMLAASRDNRF